MAHLFFLRAPRVLERYNLGRNKRNILYLPGALSPAAHHQYIIMSVQAACRFNDRKAHDTDHATVSSPVNRWQFDMLCYFSFSLQGYAILCKLNNIS